MNPAAPMRTELFVYGTLRHDQPEHRAHCRGVTGWRPARVRGRLHRLREGWLLLVVPPVDIALEATADPATDERSRAALPPPPLDSDGPWVDGELLGFDHPESVWPPLDDWEAFSPGRPGIYRRAVIPVVMTGPDGPSAVHAWAYVAEAAPEGSREIDPTEPLV